MTRKHVLAPTLADSEGFHIHRRDTSDNPTFESSYQRRIIGADIFPPLADNQVMLSKPTKRASTPPDQLGHRWYFAEHATALGYIQADAERALGWPRGKINALWNGKQRYTQETVDEVSAWLGVEPYELLMPPQEANAIRQLRAAAREIAAAPRPSSAATTDRNI